jgi:hypothetical protein
MSEIKFSKTEFIPSKTNLGKHISVAFSISSFWLDTSWPDELHDNLFR